MNDKKGILLLSGGLDSATVAAMAVKKGYDLSALTFFYGQKHKVELQSAERLAEFFRIKHHVIIELNPAVFHSALTAGSGIDVPRGGDAGKPGIPATYVPARNIIFLSYALAFGESSGARDIFIGVNALDYSGYPDCRPEFIDAFTSMANIGTRAGITGENFIIHAPLISMKKSEIIRAGMELGVDYSMTHSCYDPDDKGGACGSCDSCLIRLRGFAEAGLEDPLPYKHKKP